jgi:hypothetical protein
MKNAAKMALKALKEGEVEAAPRLRDKKGRRMFWYGSGLFPGFPLRFSVTLLPIRLPVP